MNIKVISSVIALAISGATYGGIAQAATESSEVTIEKSSTVEPRPSAVVNEERSTTTTKKGLFGRKKSESSTSTKTYERDPITDTEVKSKSTTTETDRRY